MSTMPVTKGPPAPNDRRAKWVTEVAGEATQWNLHDGFPLGGDTTVLPEPRHGMRAMRDDYNSSDPMALVFDRVWVGSARNCAWDKPFLKRNGTLYFAKGEIQTLFFRN